MNGIFEIKNLRCSCFVGCKDEERTFKQDIFVSVKYEVGIDDVLKSDNIDDALDYAMLSNKIMSLLNNKTFILIEGMAKKILDLVMSDKRILWTEIELKKPRAIDHAEYISIKLSSL